MLFSTSAFPQSDPEASFTPADEDAAYAAASRIGGDVSISIELTDAPAAVVYADSLKRGEGHASAVALAKRQIGQIRSAQARVRNELRKLGAEIFFETQNTFNGFGAYVKADRLAAVKAIDGVAAVHPLVPQEPTNAGSVPFIGAPSAWIAGSGSNYGQGMRIGIIDTGIDYIHTNFGGPGTGYGANNTTVVGDTPGLFPGAKVAGGWDFAGDAYDAGSTIVANRTPIPDPDPMDCGGHGSHVSGSAAGFGVRSDGTTYPGPYDGTTPFGTLKIGPGVAPGAKLYALRVFGCAGSTTLTTAAIDWSVDPNGDGDFSDHLDVINMSLGSPFGAAFDSSSTSAQNAALAGVLVVVAAGNNGDTHYTVSSPGAATRAVTVAAVTDDGFPAMRVNSPAGIAGLKPIGKSSGWGGALTDPGVTAAVVATVPADACNTVTNISTVAGKIAFIDRGGTAPGGAACGFELKAKNAQNAGAVGVIIGNVASSANPLIPITMGSSSIGGVTIPAVQMGLTAANEIRANLAGGINGTLLRSATTSLAANGDQAASFSSRGIRRGDNALKPDIAAPGVSIDSTRALSGNDSLENNGTSMATPHVAGFMALLKQLHPTWTGEELKALAMSTAAHDLYLNINQAPPRYNVARAGAGRADIAAASASNVIAMNDLGDGSVGVSFGAIEVLGSHASTKNVKVVNKGALSQTYSVSLLTTQTVPGVSYSLPDGPSISVGPNSSATLRVQLNATAATMKHSLDTTMTATQTTTSGAVLNRAYLSEQSAYVVLTPASGPTLRVPVHAIVRPAAAMGTAQSGFLFGAASGTNTLTLSGTQINTGASFPTDIASIVTALELAGTSPDGNPATPQRRYADIKAVGIGSNAKQLGTLAGTAPVIYFGIATHGKWTTLRDVEFDIYIDRNRDGIDDVVVFNTTQSNGANPLDVHGTSVVNALTGATVAGSVFSFINGINPSTDTVPYNSNVIVLPVRAVDAGITAATGRFNYRIQSFSRAVSGIIDTFSGSWDPLRPGISFGNSGAPLFFDFNAANLNAQYNVADYNANNSKGVLLLHHHNGDGARDQSIPASAPAATTTTAGAAAGQYSDAVTLTASVSPSTVINQTISGSVQFSVDGSPVGSAPVNTSGVATLSYTIAGGAGAHSITAAFTSSNAFFLGSSGGNTLTVSREDASVVPAPGNPASAQVSSPGGTATVTLSADITEIADGSLGNIALAAPVTITLTPIGPGSASSQSATLSVSGLTETATATFSGLAPNVYDVSFSIGGLYYSGSANSVLAVFDPSLGNVTGGGWIVRDGVRANFGFNVKYQKNGNAQGQMLYIEHRPTGDYVVKSNAISTLSIASGHTAITIGKATVNGVGNNAFRLTVVDNGEPGSNDQFGLIAGDISFAPMTISGGNIQVP